MGASAGRSILGRPPLMRRGTILAYEAATFAQPIDPRGSSAIRQAQHFNTCSTSLVANATLLTMSYSLVTGLVLGGLVAAFALLKIVFRGEHSPSDSVSESVLHRIRIEYPIQNQ